MLKLSRKARYSLAGRDICNCNGEQQRLAVRQPAKQRRRKNQQMTILVPSVGSFFSCVNDAQAHKPKTCEASDITASAMPIAFELKGQTITDLTPSRERDR